MCVVFGGVFDVAKAQSIQLGVSTATCRMDGQQNRPEKENTYEADGAKYSKEA